MAKHYYVTGAYVTVRTMTPDGPRVVGLYEGAPWPDDAAEAATEHHLAEGLIAEVGQPSKAPEHVAVPVPAAQEPDAPVGEPTGPKPNAVRPPAPKGGARHEGGGGKQ
jgi:hypothetical protein